MSANDFMLINFGAELMPERMHPEDAGMDIYAPATFHVPPHESVYVSCGFGIIMPPGYMSYTVVRGSTANMGLHVAENPIDSNYRGEVHAVVWNISNETVVIEKGKRFCQLVIVPCTCSAIGSLPRLPQRLPVVRPEEVTPTDRGDGGYGSTDGTGTPYIIPTSSVCGSGGNGSTNGTGTPYIIPTSSACSACGGGGASTSSNGVTTFYDQNGSVVEQLFDNDTVFRSTSVNKNNAEAPLEELMETGSVPLERAGELVTLRVLGKPAPISRPYGSSNAKYDITSKYDHEGRSVTVQCDADVVTLGITAKVLQRLYMEACKGLSVDITQKIHMVIEEVCKGGQN